MRPSIYKPNFIDKTVINKIKKGNDSFKPSSKDDKIDKGTIKHKPRQIRTKNLTK